MALKAAVKWNTQSGEKVRPRENEHTKSLDGSHACRAGRGRWLYLGLITAKGKTETVGTSALEHMLHVAVYTAQVYYTQMPVPCLD